MAGKNNAVGRRAIIRTIGIGALGVPIIGNVAASDSSNQYYETLRGTITDPITDEDIARAQEDVFSRYTDQEDGSDPLFLSEPSANEETTTLAYNLSIKSDGTPEEHYVKSNSNTEANELTALSQTKTARLHAMADDWMMNSPRIESAESGSSSEVGVYSNAADWGDWSDQGNIFLYEDYPPYGRVLKDYQLRRDPNHPTYALRTIVDMESGRNRNNEGDSDYYETYQNRGARVVHDWDQSYSVTTRDRYPRGQIDGERSGVSTNLGVNSSGASAGVSYSYSQPSARVTDTSSMSDNITRAYLYLDPGTSGAETNAFYQPGSLTEVDITDCSISGNYPVVAIEMDAIWGSGGVFWGSSVERSHTDAFRVWCIA